jgi:predicted RNase H-like HicB family nuclease
MPKGRSKAFRDIMAGLEEMKAHMETGKLAPGARMTVFGKGQFPHKIEVQWSEEDDAYVARVPAVGAAAHGKTADAAVRQAIKAATGLIEEGAEVQPEKNAAAVALGRAGGMKGGAARAASMTKERRAEIARKAAVARWGK